MKEGSEGMKGSKGRKRRKELKEGRKEGTKGQGRVMQFCSFMERNERGVSRKGGRKEERKEIKEG